MKYVLGLVLALGLAGCTKGSVGCKAADRASDIIAKEVGYQLECENSAAIKLFIDKKLAEAKVCQAGAIGIIGDLICPPIVDGVVAGVVTQIPSDWKCKGGLIKDSLKGQLLLACKKAF